MRAADERYHALFDSIDQGFCILEVLFDEQDQPYDYTFLEVNGAFERQTGLVKVEGRRMRELVPEHEEHWFLIYGRVAITGIPVRFEQHAASLRRWFDVYAFRVDRPELRRVALLFRDITDRKQAQDALRASEARYRALAHATANVLYRVNADGSRMLDVFGGGVPPWPGDPPGEPGGEARTAGGPSSAWTMAHVHPDDRAATVAAWRAAVAAGTTFEFEHRALRPDGSWGWMLSRAVPVRNPSGAISEWIGSATDVSGRKEAEEALRQSEAAHDAARREAERANRSKDEFLAMLGHELRNPLSPMLTALQLMRLRGMQSREQDILERQVAHLTRLVEDLMDVARVARGRVELQRVPCELSDVVLRAMEMASPLLEQRQHRVDVRVPRHGLGVHADLQRLAQVFSNLLTNAAKYSDPGARIVVTGDRIGDTIRFSVRDEGIGIAPEMLASVFEPFVQQPQTLDRAYGGVGLGLAIVRSLVTAHGGRVRAESQGLGRGSEFIVELPAAESAASREAGSGDSLLVPEHRTRVLIVDDNADGTEMLRLGLEGRGYDVRVAGDGPTALASARTFEPDVALLDIGLPGIDGYEVARRLRELSGRVDRPRLVAITGYGQDADRQRSARAGFERHMVKPIDLSHLIHVIEGSPQT